MRKNAIKEKLKAGQPVLGAFVNFHSPAVVEICGYAGVDFVIVDAEHGPMEPRDCEEMVRAADAVGITPIIRVGQNVQQVILRYLDIGALGVQMPMINTRADAELADLSYEVSVLETPEPVEGLADLDPARYGVIVRSGRRRGLLLPDIPGLGTPDVQVDAARRKAGIAPDSPIEILRFRTRHFE